MISNFVFILFFFSYVENTNHRIGWQDDKAANCKYNGKFDNVAIHFNFK